MSDEADFAGERIERDRALFIEAARRSPALPATGECYYCKEAVEEERRFCDADCRDFFDREKKLRARNGRGVE